MRKSRVRTGLDVFGDEMSDIRDVRQLVRSHLALVPIVGLEEVAKRLDDKLAAFTPAEPPQQECQARDADGYQCSLILHDGNDHEWPPPSRRRRNRETAQDSLMHPAHQVYFRAGLIACREYMARFVEAESPSIANSIRANWWPSLGQDFGPPRQLDFTEVTSGEYGSPDFRIKTAEEVSPTQEALPIALGFLVQSNPPAAPVSSSARHEPSDREVMARINLLDYLRKHGLLFPGMDERNKEPHALLDAFAAAIRQEQAEAAQT